MNRPDNMSVYESLDLKLGIKSSLPQVKSTVALAILFWEGAKRPAELTFSEQNGTKIVITNDLKQQMIKYLADICAEEKISSEKLISKINENSLFNSQLEALIVAFELIWKIAKVSFVDKNKAASAERTGGNRYQKKLNYTINMDIMHCLFENDIDAYKRVLMAWLDLNVDYNTEVEKRLLYLLTALSEGAIFKLIDENQAVIFNQNCIYKKLLENHTPVEIKGDEEPKGPLRILKSLLLDEMNPYLKYTKSENSVEGQEENELRAYQGRVDTFLRLSATKAPGTEKDDTDGKNKVNINPDLKTDFARNRIIFGAPGTGKSYRLKAAIKQLLQNGGAFERVTFHPDYSYANFVGTYKPVPYKKENGDKGITYEYVPGPFMRILVKALKNGMSDEEIKPYVLIVEEINRANMSAVFGDVFQLLDRDDTNVSEYSIYASEDMKKYLAKELGGSEQDYCEIRLPANMYIWATMNSADQGVFPMDTAFKRRWSFSYLGVNTNEDKIENAVVTMGTGIYARRVSWNELRKAINSELLNFGVNEDKLMGTFFVSKNVLDTIDVDQGEQFRQAFRNKVLMYLFDDAAKRKVSLLFSGCRGNSRLYSEIIKEFDEKGVGIFMDSISSKFTMNPTKSNGADEK